jgi:hypothetical protein
VAWRMELGHVALTVRLPVLRRISSSGRGRPNRFKLDQRPRPVLAERHRTVVNCNPNCKPVPCLDKWLPRTPLLKSPA